MHYKQYLIELIKEKYTIEEINAGVYFEMPPNAPKSTIVVKKSNPKLKAKYFYSKYIEKSYAPLEINISSRIRTQITAFITSLKCEDANYTKDNIVALLTIFDEAIHEICAVLNGCFARYNQQFSSKGS